MILRWRHNTRRESSNVDVTAFLSLMVILVPFLLITAVFSRITIIELQGSAPQSAAPAVDDLLQLRVVVRERFIELSHRAQETMVRLERTASGRELVSLAELLEELKSRYPQSSEATILLEPQIPYDLLVQVMDVVRIKQRNEGRVVTRQELFPNIALGSAPAFAGRVPETK